MESSLQRCPVHDSLRWFNRSRDWTERNWQQWWCRLQPSTWSQSLRAHLHLVGMLQFMSDINQPSLPTPFYSVLVSVSVFKALSTVFHSINSPDNSPFSDSVLPVLSLPYWSFQLYVSLPPRGAADAEIKVPSGENTELKHSPFKAWSRLVYSHISKDFFLACFYPSGPFTCTFFPKHFLILSCVVFWKVHIREVGAGRSVQDTDSRTHEAL